MPFLLEPDYESRAPDWSEPHDERMIRRFGSAENFERVKKSQNLIGRGAEVGLDASMGYTQEALTSRRQSCTINSHRLVLWTTEKFGVLKAEELYEELNRRHFLHGGILNDFDLLIDSAGVILTGVERDEITEFLTGSLFYDEVKGILSELEVIGIHGIPTLVGNGDLNHVTSGASPERDLEIFMERLISNISRGHEKVNSRLFGSGKIKVERR